MSGDQSGSRFRNLSHLPTTALWAPMIFLRRTSQYVYEKSFAHALYLGGCEGLLGFLITQFCNVVRLTYLCRK